MTFVTDAVMDNQLWLLALIPIYGIAALYCWLMLRKPKNKG
jgi:hypothetical protein